LTITTDWVLTGRPNIQTYAYFTSSASALSDGLGDNIPASSVSGSVNGGAFQIFNGACPFSANTCVTTLNIVKAPNRSTDNTTLQLQISTVGLSLRAGTYTGVLHIRAVAL